MSYVYGRRYNNFQSRKNSNRNNNFIGSQFNPYQPRTANSSMNNQHSYYSSVNSLKKVSPMKKDGYNRPSFNYGNLLKETKYNSVRKNGNDPLISNSYNIINNFKDKNSQANLTMYNKRFSSNKNNNISKLLNYENKKREKEQFYFSNKNKKKLYNNDNKQNENIPGNINYQYPTQFIQKNPIKPTTAPGNLLSNNNINSLIKSLESDTKQNDKIIKENNISPISMNNNNNINNNINSNINTNNNNNKKIISNNINNNDNVKKDIKKENDNKKEEKISDINLSEFYEDNCSLVLNYSYKEDPNSKYRDYMEDKARAIENLNGDENNLLFCLFDGHGGNEVSSYLQNSFHIHMKNHFPFTPNEKVFFFANLFKDIDKKLKDLNYIEVGSTAVIVYITKENNKKYLYCVNIGDSRCLLIKSNEWKRISYDDRASDKNEHDRIIKEGGIVMDGRVYGQLMLSRAFGDRELKEYGVSNEPHVNKIEIKKDDLFVVLASDGVWDVVEDSEVYKMSLLANNSKDLCKNILKEAIGNGSFDNISCFVIQLN